MTFVFKMAWRDSRAARGRLLLAALSIVLGITALVAVASLSSNLRHAIDGQAKQLLGADLTLSSPKPFPEAVTAFLAGQSEAVSRGVTFTSMLVMPSSGGKTRLVSVRALEGDFPYYGDFTTDPQDAAKRLRNETGSVVLESTLLTQYAVKAGDPVKLGLTTFTIGGALNKIAGDSLAAGLFAPRVFVSMKALPATGLLNAGSIARYEAYAKLRAGVDAEKLRTDFETKFPEARLQIGTVAGRQRELGKTLGNLDSFLSLVGFIALLLGAIGVGSAVQVYVKQKLATVAILRCLGSSARQSFSIYVVQGLALGVVGALAGASLGVAVQAVLAQTLGKFLPVPVEFFIAWPAVLRGAGVGLVICVLFTLLPLLAVRRVPPLAVLRADAETEGARRDPWRLGLFAVIALAVVAFAVLQAPRPLLGLGFAGVLGVSFALLAGLSRAVMWATRKFFPKRASYTWRQGLANLHRPNNRTTLLLVSLGLGAALMLTLVLTRATFLGQLGDGRGDRPNLLFFDIQDDQIAPLTKQLADAGAPLRSAAPVVTMRLVGLKGRPVEELLKEKDNHLPAWALRREYRSTFRGQLASTEKLTAGTFAARAPAGAEEIPISVEVGLADDLKLALGDALEFDVQGVRMKTRITSLREVEWRRMEPNFFMVFPEGVLEDAPKVFLVSVRAAGRDDSARIQQLVTNAFPNVSAIDLGLVLETLDGILSKVEYVVRLMVLFTVATGIVVLAGSVVSGRSQRLRETVLLRTLGATRSQLLRIQLVEYSLLGVLGAITGGALSVGAVWLLARFVFDTPLIVPPLTLLASVAAVALVTIATGWLANRGIADQSPLEALRRD